MTMGEKLQLLRKSRGLSQEQLAAELDVSRQAVSKWECGDSTPDLDKLRAICTYFGVTTDYLIWENEGDAPRGAETAAPDAEKKPDYRIRRDNFRASVRKNGYWAGYAVAIVGGSMLLRLLISLVTVGVLMGRNEDVYSEFPDFFWGGPVRMMLPYIIVYLVLLVGGLAFAWWYKRRLRKQEEYDDL